MKPDTSGGRWRYLDAAEVEAELDAVWSPLLPRPQRIAVSRDGLTWVYAAAEEGER